MRESFEKNKKGIVLMLTAAVLFLICGFALYGVGAVIMLLAYRYGSVSVLQPMMSANYVLSAILGFLVLQEKISALKVVGIIIITSGVILIAGGDAE